ncbi:MAG: hypothetical protein J6033_05750 [Lachnospiraceae bacterium]|nr:hypothetical protein [Lachnospiraceae bacterium]
MFVTGNMNFDISKYLPDESGVYKGLSIMREEFSDIGKAFDLIGEKVNGINFFETFFAKVPVWAVVILAICLFAFLLCLCRSYLEPVFIISFSGVSLLMEIASNGFFHDLSYFSKVLGGAFQVIMTFPFFMIVSRCFSNTPQKGGDRHIVNEALEVLIKAWKPVVMLSLTEVFSFVLMCFCKIPFLRELGLVGIKGVVISLIVALIIEPVVLSLCRRALEGTAFGELKVITVVRGFEARFLKVFS